MILAPIRSTVAHAAPSRTRPPLGRTLLPTFALALGLGATAATPALAQQRPTTAELKKEVAAEVASLQKLSVDLVAAIDILTNPALLEEARKYFKDVQTREYQWVSLIPRGTKPPVHLNEEEMESYRPLLESLIYDPTRYATYRDRVPHPAQADGAGRRR